MTAMPPRISPESSSSAEAPATLEHPQHPVAGHLAAEEELVLPLDLGHRQDAVDHVELSAVAREDRGLFVLDDVAAFQPARAVHRREPAADAAEDADRAPDAPEDHFADAAGLSAELPEQSADQFAVMPLLRFDLLDAFAIGAWPNALPVTSVRIARRQLPGVRAPQLAEEFGARIGGHSGGL
jgi:hypothetical protein